MITLPNPIEVHPLPTVTVTSLRYTLIDDGTTAKAQIDGFPKTLVLWTGEDYTKIGDYTQAQADARLLEVLGSNPAAVLESLYYPPISPVVLPKFLPHPLAPAAPTPSVAVPPAPAATPAAS